MRASERRNSGINKIPASTATAARHFNVEESSATCAEFLSFRLEGPVEEPLRREKYFKYLKCFDRPRPANSSPPVKDVQLNTHAPAAITTFAIAEPEASRKISG